MPYLLSQPDDCSPAELRARYEAYRGYIESERRRLPKEAAEFALAGWHYDPTDHRCPHDAWVEEVSISEPASGERREIRGIVIRVVLLGAYHDGRLQLTYPGVVQYSFLQPRRQTRRGFSGHGDWLLDELSAPANATPDHPLVAHDVVFSNDAAWRIEAENIVCEWLPIEA